jgi:hypothetical protein
VFLSVRERHVVLTFGSCHNSAFGFIIEHALHVVEPGLPLIEPHLYLRGLRPDGIQFDNSPAYLVTFEPLVLKDALPELLYLTLRPVHCLPVLVRFGSVELMSLGDLAV